MNSAIYSSYLCDPKLTLFYRIWVVSFVNSLQQSSNWSWTPYVTSEFALHGLTGITNIVANIVGGVSRLPLAKFIDLVGRPQGFIVCLVSVTLGASLIKKQLAMESEEHGHTC